MNSKDKIINHLVVFFGVALLDILYVFYLKFMTNNLMFQTSVMASIITLTNGIVYIKYTIDQLTIISAVLGAFCGTYISMYFLK
jgi:hypothetical protein